MKFTLAIAALVATTSATWWANIPQTSLVSLKVEESMPLDEMFKEIDTNGDKSLTMEEVTDAIRGFAAEHDFKLPQGWEAEVQKVFDEVDANKNGKVTMEEIKGAIFDHVDSNDDGEWSLKEVVQALKGLAKDHGVQLKKGWKKEVRAVFKMVDADNSGKVSPAELEAAIEKHGYPDLKELVK